MEGMERRTPAWILCAGFALLALGLSTEGRPQGGEQEPPPESTRPSPQPMGFGTADSNGQMIAVTGIDVTGGSLLYLIDTASKHLSVYQAIGGTKSTMNLKWVGARNIDLDLQVDGWNDESEYSYKRLASEFEKQGTVSLPEK